MEKKEIEEHKAFHKKYIRTSRFEKVRDAVFERDGYKCVCCGRTEGLVCHHTTYKHLGEGGELEISDCVTMCLGDHIQHHKGGFNYRWYSPEHPRNRNDLREVDGLLVTEMGDEVYDAKDWHKYPIYTNNQRYDYKSISVNGKTISVHRLIAKAFPEICGEWFDECEVHHLDKDRTNNRASNLKIMTQEEHKKIHAKEQGDRSREIFSIPTHQYTMSGEYVATFSNSIEAAESVGVCNSSIRNCICGLSASAAGFVWRTFDGEPPKFIEPTLSCKEKAQLAFSIPISQYTLDGEWVRDWSSQREAREALGHPKSGAILNCLKGRSKSAYGSIWKYKQ